MGLCLFVDQSSKQTIFVQQILRGIEFSAASLVHHQDTVTVENGVDSAMFILKSQETTTVFKHNARNQDDTGI
jgi:hypothetical protein